MTRLVHDCIRFLVTTNQTSETQISATPVQNVLCAISSKIRFTTSSWSAASLARLSRRFVASSNGSATYCWKELQPETLPQAGPPFSPSRCRATSLRVRATGALGNTLHAWREEIACMWRFTRKNGITEGFHTKMEVLQRQAYGFDNFQSYRLRVKVMCS